MIQSSPAYLSIDVCPVCRSRNRRLHYKGTRPAGRESSPSDYACTSSAYGCFPDIVRCADCGLIYSSTAPSPEALAGIYAQVEDNIYVQEEAGRIKTFSKALEDLDRFAPAKGKLLELGSYTGVYLELARQRGWNVTGIELSAWARQAAAEKRNLELISSLNDLPSAARFDAVVMWDVIEHVPDPNALLAQASAYLQPGGVLGLSTMVLDSLTARLMRRRYPFLMEMHLIYFTKSTLVRLLENHGFEVLAYQRHARYVSSAYLAGKLAALRPLVTGRATGTLLRHWYWRLSAGVRDVYARKKAK